MQKNWTLRPAISAFFPRKSSKSALIIFCRNGVELPKGLLEIDYVVSILYQNSLKPTKTIDFLVKKLLKNLLKVNNYGKKGRNHRNLC